MTAVAPREKARRDAERPHLRIAEPPLDPTVHEAPGRTGLPLPDVGDALDARERLVEAEMAIEVDFLPRQV